MLSNPHALRSVTDAAEKTALLPDRIRRAVGVETEPTPYRVVYSENKTRLRYYESTADQRRAVPMVFTYAFINTPAILDLDAERSVVGQFLDSGFDVYVVDWGDPSRLDASLTLDDYVGRYLDNCVDVARERSGADAVNLVGYSTGSPISVMYAALFPEKVSTLGLQGPPLVFDVDGGMFDFRELAATSGAGRLVDELGNVPAPLIDAGFAMNKPVDWTAGTAARLWDELDDAEAIEREARIGRWAFDGPDMAGATFRQFAADLFLGNALVENEFDVGETTVDVGNITMPVAMIVGRDDDFVPHEASLPFLDAVPSEDTAVFEFPSGHIGTFVDDAVHDEWWPRVCEWFAERS